MPQLIGKAYALGSGYPGIITRDLNSHTLVATLLDAWHYRVSARSGWPGVSIL